MDAGPGAIGKIARRDAATCLSKLNTDRVPVACSGGDQEGRIRGGGRQAEKGPGGADGSVRMVGP